MNSLVGRPVLIKSGDFVGKFGKVIEFSFGLYIVEVGDITVAAREDQLEPYFNLQEVAAVHVTEVDDDGDPVGTTDLEKMVIPFGMTSEQLAETVADVVVDATARIKGVGKDQYSQPGFQKFEGMPLMELFEYADEELLDLINYAVMLRIRLIRICAGLFDADIIENGDDDEDSHAGH